MLSRVADSLYWMARYAERAEHGARLLRVRLEAMVEQGDLESTEGWRRMLHALADVKADDPSADPRDITYRVAFDRTNLSSIFSSLFSARDNARQVREQISSEMWEHINREYLRVTALDFDWVWSGNPAQTFIDIGDGIWMFQGITNSTMRHGEGFDFIELGTYLERAQMVARLLEVYLSPPQEDTPKFATPGYFDWINLLKQVTGFEAYCKVYTASIAPRKIAEFLIFDPEFPHSVRFAVDKVQSALEQIAPGAPQTRRAACARMAGRLKAFVDFTSMDEIAVSGIGPFLASVLKQCEAIHGAVYESYISYGTEDGGQSQTQTQG
jgi:uncharacterized alpha-E superfamily protein